MPTITTHHGDRAEISEIAAVLRKAIEQGRSQYKKQGRKHHLLQIIKPCSSVMECFDGVGEDIYLRLTWETDIRCSLPTHNGIHLNANLLKLAIDGPVVRISSHFDLNSAHHYTGGGAEKVFDLADPKGLDSLAELLSLCQIPFAL